MRTKQWWGQNGGVTPVTTTRRIIGAAASLSAIAAVVTLLTPWATRSQSSAHHDWAAERWIAQWIAWPEAPQRDTGIFHFRKKIDVAALPAEFIVHVSADNRKPYWVSGSIQDIGTAQGPSNSLSSHGIPLSAWRSVGGGEAAKGLPAATSATGNTKPWTSAHSSTREATSSPQQSGISARSLR